MSQTSSMFWVEYNGEMANVKKGGVREELVSDPGEMELGGGETDGMSNKIWEEIYIGLFTAPAFLCIERR